jgi:hypothetical protein
MFTEIQKQEIKEIFESYKTFNSYISFYDIFNHDPESINQVIEEIETLIFQTEVIYYSVAIDILKNNDISLRESLEIAEEYGYSPKSLNSEILATLLIQKYLQEDATKLIEEIENLLID